MMAEIGHFGLGDDVEFARYLVSEVGVAVVPGSSFYHAPKLGQTKVRFAFCKCDETLHAAGKQLASMRVPAASE